MMRRGFVRAVGVLLFLVQIKRAAQMGGRTRGYTPAKFRDLLMGKSLRDHSLQRLGVPTYSGPVEGDPDTIEDGYEKGGLFPFSYNRVCVLWDRRSKVITSIRVQLKQPVAIAELKRQFEGRWIQTKWDQDTCNNPDREVLFESPLGRHLVWENRSAGLSYQDDSMTFEYRSSPPGLATSPRCK